MFGFGASSPTSRHSGVARFSRLGEHGGIWLVIAAVGAVTDSARRTEYARSARAVLIAYAVNQGIKLVVRRRRPRGEHGVRTLSDLSYPSAHAATSAAAARTLPLPSAPLWALAAALAGSRLYLGVHYPTDTLAGAALGGAVAELIP